MATNSPPANPPRIPAVPFDCALVGARVPGESRKAGRPDSESLDSKDGALSPLASGAWPMRNPGVQLCKVWVAGRQGGRRPGSLLRSSYYYCIKKKRHCGVNTLVSIQIAPPRRIRTAPSLGLTPSQQPPPPLHERGEVFTAEGTSTPEPELCAGTGFCSYCNRVRLRRWQGCCCWGCPADPGSPGESA